MTATFTTLTLEQIVPNPDQPRKHFDPDALAELAASITASGLIEPLIVRPVGDEFVLVAGERRWRAARIAQLVEVPVRVMDLGEVDAYVLSVAENVNRADMTAGEEAESFAQLVAYGKPTADVAALFGKSEEYVRVRLSFLDLVPEARRLLDRGEVGTNLARYIAALQPGNQRHLVNLFARGEFKSEIEATHFARSLADAEAADGLFDVDEPTEEDRVEREQSAKQIRRSLDQVDRLMSLLSDLADRSPAELAAALGQDLNPRLAQVERITGVAQRARQQMRKAKATAAASTLEVRPDLTA